MQSPDIVSEEVVQPPYYLPLSRMSNNRNRVLKYGRRPTVECYVMNYNSNVSRIIPCIIKQRYSNRNLIFQIKHLVNKGAYPLS